MQAREVMTKDCYLAQSTDTIEQSLQALKLWQIDKLFVFEGTNLLGTVNANRLKHYVYLGASKYDTISQYLDDSLCMVSPNAGIEMIKDILQKKKLEEVIVYDEEEGLIGSVSWKELKVHQYKLQTQDVFKKQLQAELNFTGS